MIADLIAIGVIVVPILMFALMEWSYMSRHKRLIDFELHVRGQKREIVEALALIQYGAKEEAMELLQNSKLFKDA